MSLPPTKPPGVCLLCKKQACNCAPILPLNPKYPYLGEASRRKIRRWVDEECGGDTPANRDIIYEGLQLLVNEIAEAEGRFIGAKFMRRQAQEYERVARIEDEKGYKRLREEREHK